MGGVLGLGPLAWLAWPGCVSWCLRRLVCGLLLLMCSAPLRAALPDVPPSASPRASPSALTSAPPNARPVEPVALLLVPFISPTRGRGDDVRYVRSMISANPVRLVRRDIPDISPTSNFGGYRVAVQTASAGDALMRSRFPQAQMKRFDNAGDALRAVASGDADIFIGYRQVAVHQIEKNLMANLQVRGSPGAGAHRGWPGGAGRPGGAAADLEQGNGHRDPARARPHRATLVAR